MITYNHEKYIAQAIESVLIQQTDFEYELVIGEDCSTDKTREILLNYKETYPNRIRLLLPNQNLGMMVNLVMTLKECSGEYIALLEGDDYWTDIYKLQKQVSFLERNTEYSICFHKVMIYHEYDISKNYESNKDQSDDTSFVDLCKENYIATASVVYSKLNASELPDWFAKASVGDWTLHLFNAQFGKIKYLADNMAVYRIHTSGVWSTLQSREQAFKSLQLNEFFTDSFPKKFRPYLQLGRKYLKIKLFDQIRPQLIENIERCIDTGNRSVALNNLYTYYKYCRPKDLKNIVYLLRKLIRIMVGRSSF